jgi:hypothetical protein
MKYDIHVKDAVIKLSMFGSFNLDIARTITKKIRVIIESLNNQPFYILVDLSTIEGGTPDGFEQGRKFNLWLDSQNLKAKAIICHSPLFRSISESRVRSSDIQLIKYFNNEADALRWFDELSLANMS